MKKVVKFLSFAFVGSFLLVGTALAGDKVGNTKASESAVREQVAGALSHVSFQDGNEVNIYFAVTPEKGFKLLKVSGENAELTSEVEKTLKDKSLAVQSSTEGKYMVTVKFKDITSL